MATVNLQKTSATKPKSINYEVIGGRKNVIRKENKIFKTPSRAQIGHQTSILPSLDDLPLIDRSLIDYTKYHKYVGHAGRKYSMAMQATRGCPYKCFYCDIYKTTINHYRRSVDSIVEEVKILYDMGIRRIEFIDDIFNVNVKHCASFFNSVKKAGMDIEFMFPNGLKGDLFTKPQI